MQIITFEANNGKNTLAGTLIVRSKLSQIMFETKLSEFKDQEINEKNIKDYPNFIASFINRLDKDEKFNSLNVTVDGVVSQVDIIRKGVAPAKETEKVFVVTNKDNTNVIIKDQTLSLVDSTGKTFETTLSSLLSEKSFITVPVDFAYNRDPILNDLLKYNLMPFNYKKELNNIILNALKEAKKYAKQRETVPEFAYVDFRNKLTFSEAKTNKFVIPKSFFV